MKTPQTAQEITAANLDGDPMTGVAQQTHGNGDILSQPAQRFARDGQIDRYDADTRAERDSLQPAEPKPAAKLKLPTPWENPSPKPSGF